MTTISGVLTQADMKTAVRDVRRLLGQSRWYMQAVFLLAVIGAFWWCPVIIQHLWSGPPERIWPLTVFSPLAVFLGLIAWERIILWRVQRRMRIREMLVDSPFTMALAPEALVCESNVGKSTINWAAVTDLVRSGNAWIFVVEAQPFPVPHRVFVDVEAERQFVKEALGHMGDLARARSKEALSFVKREEARRWGRRSIGRT